MCCHHNFAICALDSEYYFFIWLKCFARVFMKFSKINFYWFVIFLQTMCRQLNFFHIFSHKYDIVQASIPSSFLSLLLSLSLIFCNQQSVSFVYRSKLTFKIELVAQLVRLFRSSRLKNLFQIDRNEAVFFLFSHGRLFMKRIKDHY